MSQTDKERAKLDGYNAGRNGEPSRPPNDHGFVNFWLFETRKEAQADDAYRAAYKDGAKDRKRHQS